MSGERFDVIVVGAGSAGLPCAILAAECGARVAVIESSSEIGGTLHVAGGHLSAAGTRRQQERGIQDTPDDHYADVIRINRGTSDPTLVRLAVDHAAATVDWLDDLGYRQHPDSPQRSVILAPYLVERVHWGASGVQAGPDILRALRPAWERQVAAGRIELFLRHSLTGLACEDGAIAGVRVEGPAGSLTVHGDSVVLATGGYGASPKLFRELTPGAPDVLGLAPPANTGGGIVAAREVGGSVVGADRYLVAYGIMEESPGSERGASRLNGIDLRPERARREIWVNQAGERFVAEDSQSIVKQHAALLAQPGQRAWLILDAAALRDGESVHLDWDAAGVRRAALEGRHAWSADAPADLARLAGIAPAGLERTLAAWNAATAAAATGSDELGRTSGLVPLAEPPYVAVLMRIGVMLSFGGLAVDGELRVLGEGDVPIPGLYAAGEILGAAQTSGKSYTGGMQLTPALTFGRLLGERLGEAAARRAAPAPPPGS